MSLALCPQVVSQAPQHFRSSKKQATCQSCFARQSTCSVVSLHSGMSRAVHPQEFSKVNVDHRHIPSGLPFHFSLSVASSVTERASPPRFQIISLCEKHPAYPALPGRKTNSTFPQKTHHQRHNPRSSSYCKHFCCCSIKD